MTIKNRLRLIFSLFLFLVVVISLSIYQAKEKTDSAAERFVIAVDLRQQLSELNAITYENLLYHEKRMKVQWNISFNNALRLVTAGEVSFEAARKRELIEAIRTRFTSIEELFAQLNTLSEKKKKVIGQKESAGALFIISSLEAQLTSQMLLKISASIRDSQELENFIQAEMEKARAQANFIIFSALLVFAVFFAAALLSTNRSIAVPLSKLAKAVREIGSGNLDYILETGRQGRTISPIGAARKRVNEMEEISWHIDEMRIKIKESHSRLEEQVKEKTSELSIALEHSKEQNLELEGARNGMLNIVEDLKKSERKLKEAHQMAQLGTWEWNVKTGEVEWSDELYIIFQLDPKNFTPQIDSILELSPWPEDHNRGQELIQRAIESHEQGSYEQKFLRPDKSLGYYFSTFQGIYDNAGDLVSMIGTVQDITERKTSEAVIKKINEELEQRVDERTAQLQESNNDLEAFAYSVSHDLRAPLRAIGGYSQMLIEDYGNKLDADGRRQLNVVRDSAGEMGQLIDGLLAFSRLGRAEMHHLSIDMESLVKEVFAKLQQSEESISARLLVKPLPAATGDRVLLTTVLTNLLSNAIKFAKPGRPAIIEVTGSVTGHENLYSVKDNGVGFDMKYVAKMFQVFQRLHSAKDFAGTGIGLALVERIIQRCGGRVWAEGDVDKGATVYFTLARQEERENDRPN